MTLALRTLLLSVCLLVSGSAALIYEVLWSRQFALVMGSTVYALSTVISVFLGGLALGAWVGGRWTRRHGASLRLYGALEIGIGVTAVAVPLFIRLLDPLFGIAYRSVGDSLVTYSLVQLVLCAPVILVPTMLMGATLPVATAWLLRGSGEVTRGVSVLYAMNTLGGVAGAAAAGFFLLPRIGMASTAWVAVGLNFTAGLLALAVSRAWEKAGEGAPAAGDRVADAVAPPAAASGPWSTAPAALALLYGVSGFAALCLEVAWARLVGLSIGSTTYGFTIILVAFIAGIGFGSLLLPRLRFLTRDPVRGIFLLHAVIALAGILSVGYLGELPSSVLQLTTDPERTAGGLIARELALVFGTIALPALAMGGIFPLLTALLHRGASEPGYAIGLAYSANTIGNILGSLVAGFVLIPLIGMRATIIAAGALSGLAGIAYLLPKLQERSPAALAQAVALAVAIGVAAMTVPAWNPALLTSAPFLAQPGSAAPNPSEAAGARAAEIVEFREGASTVVTVAKTSTGSYILSQDGVGESNTFGNLHRTMGHLPFLLHGNAKRALVIGLGAGHTLSAVATHPLEHIDCVEISPEVVDAARKYFVRDGIDDPRVRLRVGDGRNHLRHSGELYDVIVSQPSQTWLAGASSLFTRDFFTEVRDHLAPGGIAASWFYAYTEDARQSIVGAFAEAFPTSFLFNNQGVPTLLIGLKDDKRLSAAAVQRAIAAPRVFTDVARLQLDEPAKVLATLVAGRERMRQYRGDIPANSDDNGYVAFHGLGNAVPAPLTPLVKLQEDPLPFIDPTLASPQLTEGLAAYVRAAAERRQAQQ